MPAKARAVRMKIRAAPIRQAKRQPDAARPILLAGRSRSLPPSMSGGAFAKPKPASAVPASGTSPQIVPMSPAPEQRLANARASLAKARSSLATIGDVRPAGLLQFPGSDTWSLNRIA